MFGYVKHFDSNKKVHQNMGKRQQFNEYKI